MTRSLTRLGLFRFGLRVVPGEGAAEFGRRSGDGLAAPRPEETRRVRPGLVVVRERLGRIVMDSGLPGALAVALLLAAAVLGFIGKVSLDERRTAADEERARLAFAAERPQLAQIDERSQLDAFFERFPPVAELPARLRHLNEHAGARGILVQRTDFNSTPVAGTPLTVVNLALPVRGDAAALYDWLAALLQDMPEIALESLTLERESTETTEVEGEIRLQLYLRGRS